MKKEKRKCIYCLANDATTKDHVPPKGLFIGIQNPSNLITVPCCQECNSGFSKDDEYFLIFLTLIEGNLKNAYRNSLFGKLKSIKDRPQSHGLYTSLERSTSTSTIINEKGIYLLDQPIIEINQTRIKRVLARIVKGLAYHDEGIISNKVETVIDNDKVLQNEEMIKLLKDSCYFLKDTPFKEVGNNQIFCYRYIFPKTLPFISFWQLKIFDTFNALAYCEHDKSYL
jgi:hypothetical protein